MNNANMPKGRGMIKWTPFAAMPEQFSGIQQIVRDKIKVPRPILTQDEKEIVENKLLTALLSQEEVLITYYDDGFILSEYITVMNINPIKKQVHYTDAFYKTYIFEFQDIIDINI